MTEASHYITQLSNSLPEELQMWTKVCCHVFWLAVKTTQLCYLRTILACCITKKTSQNRPTIGKGKLHKMTNGERQLRGNRPFIDQYRLSADNQCMSSWYLSVDVRLVLDCRGSAAAPSTCDDGGGGRFGYTNTLTHGWHSTTITPLPSPPLMTTCDAFYKRSYYFISWSFYRNYFININVRVLCIVTVHFY